MLRVEVSGLRACFWFRVEDFGFRAWAVGFWGTRCTWRFMGSYKWGYKSPNK